MEHLKKRLTKIRYSIACLNKYERYKSYYKRKLHRLTDIEQNILKLIQLRKILDRQKTWD
jgi:hypothetical protein